MSNYYNICFQAISAFIATIFTNQIRVNASHAALVSIALISENLEHKKSQSYSASCQRQLCQIRLYMDTVNKPEKNVVSKDFDVLFFYILGLKKEENLTCFSKSTKYVNIFLKNTII